MRALILASLLQTIPMSAAIFHPMDTTLPLSCSFSIHQHNRILIESGRIKKIIFPEDKLFVRMEETSGQVFIQAKTFIPEKTVISIISQTGIVQDIEIEFTDQPSQVVILQEINSLCPLQEIIPLPLQEAYIPCPTEDLSSIVTTLLHGQIPSGFLSLPFTNACTTIKSGIKAKLIGRLQGCHEDLYIYQIHNARIWKKRLVENDLASCDTLWVYLQKSCLKPKETVFAIVSVKR